MIKRLLLWPFRIKCGIENHFLKKLILSFGNSISCPTVMFNRENIGNFEFAEEYGYNLDWEAWLRLAGRDGRFVFVNVVLMFHRLHPGSQTSIQIDNNNRLAEEEMILGKIWPRVVAKFLMFFYRRAAKFN
jgi:hypothetical protein